MAQRTGLGKGLELLIPTGGRSLLVSAAANVSGGVQQVAVELISQPAAAARSL